MLRFRFSLKTLLIAVTVFCCWIGYQLNWIRQRREEIDSKRVRPVSLDFLYAKPPPPARAPKMLWLFGEKGYRIIIFDAYRTEETVLTEERRVKRLFPEATVTLEPIQMHRLPWIPRESKLDEG
jgi:hypothetical protein